MPLALQDNAANVYSIDRFSGAERWAYRGVFSGGYMPTNVYIAGGRVFVGCADGNVHALNATTGTRLWVHEIFESMQDLTTFMGSAGYQGSLDYDHEKGMVFVGTMKNYTVALNASSGEVMWRFTVCMGGLRCRDPANHPANRAHVGMHACAPTLRQVPCCGIKVATSRLFTATAAAWHAHAAMPRYMHALMRCGLCTWNACSAICGAPTASSSSTACS